jgi:hypothetical protein
MGTNQDGKNWQYACQNCGTPYTSKPKFCYDCGYRTILPLTAFENATDDCDEWSTLLKFVADELFLRTEWISRMCNRVVWGGRNRKSNRKEHIAASV